MSKTTLYRIILQYRAELNQGLNELAGRGTPEEQMKQALTLLFKELAAEAKLKTMPANLSPEDYEMCGRVVNQYHQNLLKALEEV